MMKRKVWSVGKELIEKSRESALTAIKIFNDPLISFKSESFIVLMIISWTYLMHSYFRKSKIDYKYYSFKGKRKRYDRTKRGAYKYWELERCLNDTNSPIDVNTKNNLLFLIGLRHEIEHQMTRELDNYLSGRYQACVFNYNEYIKTLFGDKYSLDEYLTYSIQFLKLSNEQISGPKPEIEIPSNLRTYILEFDGKLTHEEYNHENYSYRLVFSKKNVNRPGQADRVIEFIDPKSELAENIQKEYWVKKEVERPKYRPSDIVKLVKEKGYSKFSMTKHTELWQKENAKDKSKNYGVLVSKQWYWYDNWLEKCIELCEKESEKYKET